MLRVQPIETNDNLKYVREATELIEHGALESLGDGRFQVDTSDLQEPVIVTINSCRCADFAINQIRCEHIWAVIGATAAMVIGDVDRAHSPAELSNLARSHKELINSLPAAYARAVWKTVSSRSCELASLN